MQPSAVWTDVPDPMHLQPWEEQDEPLATDFHHDEQTYFFYALRYLLNQDGHYVTRDRWLRMSPHHDRSVLPDILIALDIQEQQWGVDVYKWWEAGKPPEFVAEFLSPSSTTADQKDKFNTYAEIGVKEYFIFDPDGTFGVPRIRGWHLRGSTWLPLPSGPGHAVTSLVVPVRFALIDEHLVIIDQRTGKQGLTYAQVQALAFQEEQARLRAEEVARIEAQARRRAEEVARTEEQARRRAEEVARIEHEALQRAEAEIARLRAELERRHKAD